MGYEPKFAVFTRVRIVDRGRLEEFARTWKYHHPLAPEQMAFAGSEVIVGKVGMYHGGTSSMNSPAYRATGTRSCSKLSPSRLARSWSFRSPTHFVLSPLARPRRCAPARGRPGRSPPPSWRIA